MAASTLVRWEIAALNLLRVQYLLGSILLTSRQGAPVTEPWAISIDIEGFSAHYCHSEAGKSYAIRGLSELMGAIYRVGRSCYPGSLEQHSSERLFAYQYGDGFLVASDRADEDASRPVAIAVALMRHMVVEGYATKAAIAAGTLADIRGCYPEPMRNTNEGLLDMGAGLMTIISVMGTALTRAHGLASKYRGAVLAVDPNVGADGVPAGGAKIEEPARLIDWVSPTSTQADDIAGQAGLRTADPAALRDLLDSYCRKQPTPSDRWIKATFDAIVAVYT